METTAYGVVHFFPGGTKEQYDAAITAVQFRNGILMPRMEQGIEGGFTSPPEETVVDLYTLMP